MKRGLPEVTRAGIANEGDGVADVEPVDCSLFRQTA
jgi:hypothetical protein